MQAFFGSFGLLCQNLREISLEKYKEFKGVNFFPLWSKYLTMLFVTHAKTGWLNEEKGPFHALINIIIANM